MFRPERMSLLETVFLKEHLALVGSEMLRLAVLHVENAGRFTPLGMTLQSAHTADERAQLTDLRARVEAVEKSLGLSLRLRRDIEINHYFKQTSMYKVQFFTYFFKNMDLWNCAGVTVENKAVFTTVAKKHFTN